MPGLGRDDDRSASTSDDVAELLQNERSTVKVDLEDRLRGSLRRRNACGMDYSRDIAQLCSCLNARRSGAARGSIGCRGAGVETGIEKNLPRRIGVLL